MPQPHPLTPTPPQFPSAFILATNSFIGKLSLKCHEQLFWIIITTKWLLDCGNIKPKASTTTAIAHTTQTPSSSWLTLNPKDIQRIWMWPLEQVSSCLSSTISLIGPLGLMRVIRWARFLLRRPRRLTWGKVRKLKLRGRTVWMHMKSLRRIDGSIW